MSLLPHGLWNQREPRERALLIALLLFLVITAFYILVYQPMRSHYSSALLHYQQFEKDYRWLRGQITNITRLKSAALGADLAMQSITTLSSDIEQSLQKYKIEGTFDILEEEEGRLVEIKLNEADGRTVLKWLEENMRGGHLLHSLKLDHHDNGKVSATIFFDLKKITRDA